MKKVSVFILYFSFLNLFGFSNLDALNLDSVSVAIHDTIAINTINLDSVFVQATTLYNKNNFNESLDAYLSIVDQDISNGVLYYNIGNCYYRLNQLGYARLYYEKAKLYNPKDRDVNHNIDIVKARLIDEIAEVPNFFIVKIIKDIESIFSPSQWGYVFIIIFYVNILLFLLFLFSNSIQNKANALKALFVLTPAFLFVLCFLLYSNSSQKNTYGVLVSSNAYVKNGPSELADDYLEDPIHEGVKFELIDKVDNWSRILLTDGKDGWILTSDFEVIQK